MQCISGVNLAAGLNNVIVQGARRASELPPSLLLAPLLLLSNDNSHLTNGTKAEPSGAKAGRFPHLRDAILEARATIGLGDVSPVCRKA